MNGKRLYRSETNRMICGVCAGVAEYFEIDPSLLRLAWVFLCFVGASAGFWVYLVAAIILPTQSSVQ